jgi:hypothetical protein
VSRMTRGRLNYMDQGTGTPVPHFPSACQSKGPHMDPRSAFGILARTGFAGRGLMYLVIGGVALSAGRASDPMLMLNSISQSGLGRLALPALALGLIAYGLWRSIDAALDLERDGGSFKGRAVRAGHALSGAAHLGLGLYAIFLEFGGERRGGNGAEEAAASTLSFPGGWLALIAVAAALLATGLHQLLNAWRCDFLKPLQGWACSKTWVRWVGRFGYAARGAIFILIALSFWNAGQSGSAGQADGMGEALRSLGPTELGLAGAGLVLFALFCFVEAACYRIPRIEDSRHG